MSAENKQTPGSVEVAEQVMADLTPDECLKAAAELEMAVRIIRSRVKNHVPFLSPSRQGFLSN
jgi:hypothetical protein